MDGDSRGDGQGVATSAGEGSDGGQNSLLTTPTVNDTSGFGLTMTLVTGILLALGYYGYLSLFDVGFGPVVPEPFYLLALALVFVIELSRSRSFDARGLAQAVAATAVYGTLAILAVEGGAYLWDHPEAALDEFVGVAVLAISLVVAALAYVVYLAAVESG